MPRERQAEVYAGRAMLFLRRFQRDVAECSRRARADGVLIAVVVVVRIMSWVKGST